MSEQYDNKFKGFLNGKGFYVVLALCLAGASTAAYMAMDTAADRAAKKSETSAVSRISQQEKAELPQLEEAAGKQEGVRIESSQPSSSRFVSQSSQKPQSKASAVSKQSEVPVSSAKISFALPIEGKVFTPYSNGELVKSETLGDWRTHNGVDIAADEGAAVKSACEGKVTSVKNDSLWGYVVEISHSDGVTSKYCGLSKQLSVKEGEQVKKGQVIGLVGYVPCESVMPTHLHFECKRDGKYIDPMSLM